jgi:predicted dehydrogenase
MGTTIGLVGCGVWGRRVLRDLRHLGLDVVVADPSPGAREDARAAGAETCATPDALPPVDALVIATPATTHAEVIDGLLPRGLPMLVEKPFTVRTADADRLVRAAGDRLFVGHTWRYHPGVEMLGAVARSGAIGRVTGVRSTRTNWTSPRADVDALWNLAPHDLTLAIEILGVLPEPRAVLAERHGGRIVGATALLGGEPWLVFEVSNRCRDKRREVRVHGIDGVAVMRDPDDGRIEITAGDAASQLDVTSTTVREYAAESALVRELAAFVAFVGGGPPPKSSAREGAEVVRVVAELQRLAEGV